MPGNWNVVREGDRTTKPSPNTPESAKEVSATPTPNGLNGHVLCQVVVVCPVMVLVVIPMFDLVMLFWRHHRQGAR